MISPRLFFQDLLDESNELYEPTVFRPTIQAPLALIKTVSPDTVSFASVPAATTVKTNLTAKVLDEYGGALPYANIAINGIATAQTDSNGFFTIRDISLTDTVKISYVGLGEVVYTAGSLPNTIQLKSVAIQLQSVIINIPKKPTPTAEKPIVPKPTNWLLWGSLGMAGILLYKKYSSKQVVKAKI